MSFLLSSTAYCQTNRQTVVIDAAEMGQSVRSEVPTEGKWWLNRNAQDWGASNGTILMTGKPTEEAGKKEGLWQVLPAEYFVPYRVPGFSIDPQVQGWYRIYVGLYHNVRPASHVVSDPARLLARISHEPYPEYLLAPQHATTRTVEVYWKAADLTGRKIHIEQPTAPMPRPSCGGLGGLTHVRLVPMTAAEVAAARQEIELPPHEQRLFGMLDYIDEVFWWGNAQTEDDMRAIVYRHQQSGFGRIYWRCFGTHLDNSFDVPAAAPRWTAEDEERWKKSHNCEAGWIPYFNISKRFDPLRVAVAYGKEIDCEVHAMVRMTNFNREPYANFWHEHPEFIAQRPATKVDPESEKRVVVKPIKLQPYSRVLSFAYPEVRAFYVSFFKQIASTGTQGIMIDLLRHPPIAGYEPIVADSFRKQYGSEIYERDLYKDPQVNEQRSRYLKLFLEELRAQIGNDIEISVRCSGPNNFALQGQEWIDQGLINTIVDGHWYSGNGPRPTIDETVAAVGSRGQAFAVAEYDDVDPDNNWRRRAGILSAEAITALAKQYSGRGVDRFGLYESTVFTWLPEARRAIRSAGWNYIRGSTRTVGNDSATP